VEQRPSIWSLDSNQSLGPKLSRDLPAGITASEKIENLTPALTKFKSTVKLSSWTFATIMLSIAITLYESSLEIIV
jgi:hypothetical protein